uniref:HIG1 domain-containing protein n=1 Tax=Triticum urartu TaxID=4572 RepID=A0A8R7TDB8_TRIUA
MAEEKGTLQAMRGWVVDHKLRAVGTLWLTGIAGSIAYNWSRPGMKTSVKLIHARSVSSVWWEGELLSIVHFNLPCLSPELNFYVEVDLLPAMMHELCVNFACQVEIGLAPISNARGVVVVVGTGLMGTCGVPLYCW